MFKNLKMFLRQTCFCFTDFFTHILAHPDDNKMCMQFSPFNTTDLSVSAVAGVVHWRALMAAEYCVGACKSYYELSEEMSQWKPPRPNVQQ